MEKIKLSKVLEFINTKNQHEKPVVFDIEVKSLNRFKKTGGVHKVYKGASKHILSSSKPSDLAIAKAIPRNFKMPNHKKNRTINLDVPGLSHVVKVHKRLITKFNGLEVIY